MSQKRKILGITGCRSEYDIMSSVFRAISESPSLDLELLVTGAHLSDMYGYTLKEIQKDGFQIADCVESLINGDQDSSRIKGMAVQLGGIIQTTMRLRPDFLLVLGDREEAMSTALVGNYMNIPVAHISGGDKATGHADDAVRYAISKLAHLHFVTNQESYDRILKMGEQPFRIFNTGNPGLDRLLKTPPMNCKELSKSLGFEIKEDEPLILLIQHVISTEIDSAYFQMKQTLEAVKELGIKTVLTYPNSDSGSHQLIRAIHEYKDLPFLYISKNIPRCEFVNLMRRASCLLGNSSAGILETPLLQLPAINVGNRQKGRLHAENVQFVSHDVAAIKTALKRAVYDKEYRSQVTSCSNPYGDGTASKKIVEVLSTILMDQKFLMKDITY